MRAQAEGEHEAADLGHVAQLQAQPAMRREQHCLGHQQGAGDEVDVVVVPEAVARLCDHQAAWAELGLNL